MPGGQPNERFENELAKMLAELDQAKGSNNSAIGRNGELSVIDFLNRYLPPQFRAAKGHFRRRNGSLSDEFDVMILDTRFPLLNSLSETVTAMRHAVLCTIEVKRTLHGGEIRKIRKNALAVETEFAAVRARHRPYRHADFATPRSLSFAFRTKGRLTSLAKHFFIEPVVWTDIFVMEHDFRGQKPDLGKGAIMRPEGSPCDYTGTLMRSSNPLSDFYSMLIAQSFEILVERSVPNEALPSLISSYYSWGTRKGAFMTVPFGDKPPSRARRQADN